MPHVITQENDIQAAIKQFRKRIKDASSGNEKRQWSFPSGEKVDIETYKLKTSEGTLRIGIPEGQWNNRVPHLFTFSLDKSTLSPDVEINIPLTPDRSTSGVYVKKGKDIWLCSRGIFTAGKRIKKEFAYSYFDKWLIDVSDGEQTNPIIPIAALTSPDIGNQIASFVSSVNDLKEKYKQSDNGGVPLITPVWNNSLEYEGKKTKSSIEAETEYEYLHGPICNELQKQLEKIGLKQGRSVVKNKNIDVAIIEKDRAIAIFEVKTSCSLSGQLYKGIGQLVSYKHFYGSAKTELFLVVPSIDNKKLPNLVDDLGIHLVENKQNSFLLSNGDALKEFLRKKKIV